MKQCSLGLRVVCPDIHRGRFITALTVSLPKLTLISSSRRATRTATFCPNWLVVTCCVKTMASSQRRQSLQPAQSRTHHSLPLTALGWLRRLHCVYCYESGRDCKAFLECKLGYGLGQKSYHATKRPILTTLGNGCPFPRVLENFRGLWKSIFINSGWKLKLGRFQLSSWILDFDLVKDGVIRGISRQLGIIQPEYYYQHPWGLLTVQVFQLRKTNIMYCSDLWLECVGVW